VLPLSRTFAAQQVCFRFQSDDAEFARLVEWCYRDLPEGDGPAAVFSAVRAAPHRYDLMLQRADGGVEPCGAGRDGAGLMELVAWEVNGRARATHAGGTVVHAAVFAGRHGAVAVCGDSGAGKSTLAAAAARRGWWHLSDDLAFVDVEALTVAPYARPVMLRAGGRRLLGLHPDLPEGHERFFGDEWFVPASAMGAAISHEPRPLVAVALLTWGERAAIDPLSRAHTLHGLTVHSATLAQRGRAGFDDLVRVAQAVPGHSLALGGPDEALDLLSPLVGAAPM